MPIHIVSGGYGASGDQLVHTILAQFPDVEVPVIKVPHVRNLKQIEEIVAQALKKGGTIVHTLVDPDLRSALLKLGRIHKIVTIDLVGNLLSRLHDVLGQEPVGQPGLYRQLHQVYFDRIAAIEFAVAHDDGQRPKDLPMADIVLAGVSRLGKTPLTMYLSMLGWKVVNVPLVKGIDPPHELFKVDRNRVIGLDIQPDQLLSYRRKRQARLGDFGDAGYVDLKAINRELQAAHQLFRQHRFTIIDVTNKPIETSADQIIEVITSRSG